MAITSLQMAIMILFDTLVESDQALRIALALYIRLVNPDAYAAATCKFYFVLLSPNRVEDRLKFIPVAKATACTQLDWVKRNFSLNKTKFGYVSLTHSTGLASLFSSSQISRLKWLER